MWFVVRHVLCQSKAPRYVREGSPVRTVHVLKKEKKKCSNVVRIAPRRRARKVFARAGDAIRARARRDIPENVPRRDARVLWLKHKPHARVIRWRG